jgi:hypothetical protein
MDDLVTVENNAKTTRTHQQQQQPKTTLDKQKPLPVWMCLVMLLVTCLLMMVPIQTNQLQPSKLYKQALHKKHKCQTPNKDNKRDQCINNKATTAITTTVKTTTSNIHPLERKFRITCGVVVVFPYKRCLPLGSIRAICKSLGQLQKTMFTTIIVRKHKYDRHRKKFARTTTTHTKETGEHVHRARKQPFS